MAKLILISYLSPLFRVNATGGRLFALSVLHPCFIREPRLWRFLIARSLHRLFNLFNFLGSVRLPCGFDGAGGPGVRLDGFPTSQRMHEAQGHKVGGSP